MSTSGTRWQARSPSAGLRRAVPLLAAVLCAAEVFALPPLPAPEQAIEDTSRRLYQTLDAEREKLRADPGHAFRLAEEVLLPLVDFPRLSALVIGRHWQRFDAEQRQRFAAAFRLHLVRTYATALRELGGWGIRYLPRSATPAEQDVLVRSLIRTEGGPEFPVDYRMSRERGRWQVYDVIVDGVSFAATFRASFTRELREHGPEALISRIEALNRSKLAAADEQDASVLPHK